jgi:hypothetical protein
MNTDFWRVNLKERGHLERIGVDGRTLLKQALNK